MTSFWMMMYWRTMKIQQYDIVLAGSGPCVVISPNEMNRYLRTIVVVPMTTTGKSYPTRIQVRYNDREGWLVVDQIRTLDRRRIVRVLDRLRHADIRELKSIIKETYVD